MPPSIEQNENELGFSEAIGTFDVVIDTLMDEAKLFVLDNDSDNDNDNDNGRNNNRYKNKRLPVQDIDDTMDRVFGYRGVSEKLKKENECRKYVSTLTQSQCLVLKEGILFARDPVLNYQKGLEKSLVVDDGGTMIVNEDQDGDGDDYGDDVRDKYGDYNNSNDDEDPPLIRLPAPMNYGPLLQTLLDTNTIYPCDRNENGSHQNKKVFVRGCSFPDYAEIEIWPADSTDGAVVRYGFPAIRELTLEANMEKYMGNNINSNRGGGGSGDAPVRPRRKRKPKKRKKRKSENPFVMDVESLRDLREEVVDMEKDAVLFVSAPYCKLCRQINPAYTRMARISMEEKESDVLFLKASTAGTNGRKMTFTLNIDSAPTFVVFKGGKQFGDPFGVVKLPSKKLDAVISCLEAGEEFPYQLVGMETNIRRTKLK